MASRLQLRHYLPRCLRVFSQLVWARSYVTAHIPSHPHIMRIFNTASKRQHELSAFNRHAPALFELSLEREVARKHASEEQRPMKPQPARTLRESIISTLVSSVRRDCLWKWN